MMDSGIYKSVHNVYTSAIGARICTAAVTGIYTRVNETNNHIHEHILLQLDIASTAMHWNVW